MSISLGVGWRQRGSRWQGQAVAVGVLQKQGCVTRMGKREQI